MIFVNVAQIDYTLFIIRSLYLVFATLPTPRRVLIAPHRHARHHPKK